MGYYRITKYVVASAFSSQNILSKKYRTPNKVFRVFLQKKKYYSVKKKKDTHTHTHTR